MFPNSAMISGPTGIRPDPEVIARNSQPLRTLQQRLHKFRRRRDQLVVRRQQISLCGIGTRARPAFRIGGGRSTSRQPPGAAFPRSLAHNWLLARGAPLLPYWDESRGSPSEKAEAHEARSRQAPQTPALAGDRLLPGWRKIRARLYRPRACHQICRAAEEVSGRSSHARQPARLTVARTEAFARPTEWFGAGMVCVLAGGAALVEAGAACYKNISAAERP